jgi:7-cyano-7-deazaguanine reductase
MSDPKFVLGEKVAAPTLYSPEVLYPIARSAARATLGYSDDIPMFGVDHWHLYEVSWLNAQRSPEVFIGRLTVPAKSECIVESKSLKLYLNSLNFTVFETITSAKQTIIDDLGRILGIRVDLELFDVAPNELGGGDLHGVNLDQYQRLPITDEPNAATLTASTAAVVNAAWHTHRLRSLCPITAQPDWASVQICWEGPDLCPESLMQYFLGYYQHQEYHEQCVERIYLDLLGCFSPSFLSVQAFYTRRGGIDITPFRSNDPDAKPLVRLMRQ